MLSVFIYIHYVSMCGCVNKILFQKMYAFNFASLFSPNIWKYLIGFFLCFFFFFFFFFVFFFFFCFVLFFFLFFFFGGRVLLFCFFFSFLFFLFFFFFCFLYLKVNIRHYDIDSQTLRLNIFE